MFYCITILANIISLRVSLTTNYAWCGWWLAAYSATYRYLNQSWLGAMATNGVIMPQWVQIYWTQMDEWSQWSHLDFSGGTMLLIYENTTRESKPGTNWQNRQDSQMEQLSLQIAVSISWMGVVLRWKYCADFVMRIWEWEVKICHSTFSYTCQGHSYCETVHLHMP